MFTVDLDDDSYNILARAIRARMERGVFRTPIARAWRVIQAAQPGPPWRLFADRWPDATPILDAVLRGWRAISMAIPYD